jgi:hypothetical protein
LHSLYFTALSYALTQNLELLAHHPSSPPPPPTPSHAVPPVPKLSTIPHNIHSKIAELRRRLIEASPTKQLSFQFYLDALHSLELYTSADEEILWLITTSWNNGVYYGHIGDVPESLKWMRFAVELAKASPSFCRSSVAMETACSTFEKQHRFVIPSE